MFSLEDISLSKSPKRAFGSSLFPSILYTASSLIYPKKVGKQNCYILCKTPWFREKKIISISVILQHMLHFCLLILTTRIVIAFVDQGQSPSCWYFHNYLSQRWGRHSGMSGNSGMKRIGFWKSGSWNPPKDQKQGELLWQTIGVGCGAWVA